MFTAVLIYILAVMSPGPNFILVSRFSASNSILAGLGASIGICTVGVLFSTLSILGLAIIIQKFPAFGALATTAGAIYLLYIALTLLISAFQKKEVVESKSKNIDNATFGYAFKMGVLTNILNMKTIAFMISIFAAFLSTSPTSLGKIMVIATCSSLEVVWYSSIALIFGQGIMQKIYIKYSKQIDIGLAIFLILFAIQNMLVFI